MKNGWIKWAAVAAVAAIAVPVMGLSMAPSKTDKKVVSKPAAKVSHVSTTSTAKKTTLSAKPAAKPVARNTSPRPASVRLGKNTPAKTTNLSSKSKPVMMSKTPIKPTTLHSAPAKLPTPKSTLSKTMAKTHTPSSTMKTSSVKPTNVLSKSTM
jgi:hypothetical protein